MNAKILLTIHYNIVPADHLLKIGIFLKNCLQKSQAGKYELIFRRQKKIRSDQQNKYLWGCCYKLISDKTGETVEAIHDYCKWNFGINEKQNGILICKSTTEYSTVDMIEYVAKIQQWAAEFLEIYIPNPNEVSI